MTRRQLLIQIKNLAQNNHGTYKPIAEYILEKAANFRHLSILNVAKKTNASPATITRFCQYLGLSGFRELGIILNDREIVVDNQKFLNDSLELKDQVVDIIVDTAYLIDERSFAFLINDLVHFPEKFLLFGYGESAQFLRMFASRMLRLGIHLHFFSQLEDMEIAANLVNEDSIVLALSLSGNTKLILDFVKLAKDHNAKVYSITKYEQNNLKKMSNVNFPISYDSKNLLISKTPRYAVLFLLDLIFERVVAYNPQKYLPILELTK